MLTQTPVLLLVIAAAAAPFAHAHEIGTPNRNYCEDPTLDWGLHDYGPSLGGVLVSEGDGNISGDCNGDTVPADFDGHFEYAYGGAMLTVAPEDPAFPGCASESPHHGPDIYVVDIVFGVDVDFWASVDYGCDGLDDLAIECTGFCTPAFSPGADGAYHVFVILGGGGHISSEGHVPIPVTALTVGIGEPDHHGVHSCPNTIPH